MSGAGGHLFFKVNTPIPLVNLQEKRDGKWHTWMVDDPPQEESMKIFAQQAKGKVLTTGLGLGLIVHELVKNPEVEKVTVVELSKEVIQLISKYLPPDPRIELVQENFYSFTENGDGEWNTIILDLWVTHGVEEKMEKLNHEVLPTLVGVRQRWPKASISVHGFPTLSDIKVVPKETLDFILEYQPFSSRR